MLHLHLRLDVDGTVALGCTHAVYHILDNVGYILQYLYTIAIVYYLLYIYYMLHLYIK